MPGALPRNLYVLAVAQALCMAISPFNTLVGGIVGSRLAPTPAGVPASCWVPR